jgi:hypothetical protein
LLFGNKGTDFRVGQQEQVASVQAEYVSEFDDNLAGRMAFPRFQMANVRDRRLDALSDSLVSEVELSAAFPDAPTKAPSLGTCHSLAPIWPIKDFMLKNQRDSYSY